jgi:DME family drug/metabolite transporter
MRRTTRTKLSHSSGGWFILAAAFLWGTTGTAQAFAPPDAQPMTIGTMRLAIGAVALCVLAAYRGELRHLRRWRSWPPVPTLIAAASIAAYQIFFFAAVARTGVAVGTIVGIGSTPIAAGILVLLVHQEWPGRRWMVATAFAITGCVLLILASESIRTDLMGIFLAVAAGSSYALYTMLSKDLLDKQPAGAVLTVTFSLGVILLLPVLFAGDLSWLLEPRGMAVALHLGVVTVGVGYLLFAIGLAAIPVATAATLTLAEPLTAGLLGVFVLGETLTTTAVLGIALLFVGLLILAFQRSVPAISKLQILSDQESGFPHPKINEEA